MINEKVTDKQLEYLEVLYVLGGSTAEVDPTWTKKRADEVIKKFKDTLSEKPSTPSQVKQLRGIYRVLGRGGSTIYGLDYKDIPGLSILGANYMINKITSKIRYLIEIDPSNYFDKYMTILEIIVEGNTGKLERK